MTTARWQKIEEVFQAAADLAPEGRPAFLIQACNGDRSLLDEVENLLGTDSNIEEAVEISIREEAVSLSARARESVIGQRIGPYRIGSVIGSGGMGTVYRATRDDDQFQKDVAIKIVKRGLDFDALLVRFRRERQILARLDHVNIARLLDGGATDDGLPYFVLEYVEGVPLTEYCNGKPLTERLDLFRKICAAVQYAHQNLIVHRDLKPANILITREGVPKLLDFGLAKLLNPDLMTEHTLTWMRMLTPDYASPEQVRGEAITTSSDVYSLGAVLYETVSGRAAHQFESRTVAEMERVICQTGPLALEGELGSVIQMAMRHEPERRYATVEQFSEDIRRYQDGRPVLARKDTILYRSGKFLRRNRWSILPATLAILGLLATTMFAIMKAREAGEQRQAAEAASAKAQAETRRANEARAQTETEARRTEAARAAAILQAEESRLFAGDAITSINGKLNQIPGTLKARGELALVTLQYLERLSAKAPETPKLRMDLAIAYLRTAMLQYHIGHASLHYFEASLANLQKALTIIESLSRSDPGNAGLLAAQATVCHQTGITLSGMGRHTEALQWLRRAESFSAGNGLPPRGIYKVIPGMSNGMIGEVLFELGDFRAAIARFPDGNTTRLRALASMGDLTTGWAKLEPRIKRLAAAVGPQDSAESYEAEMLRTALQLSGEQDLPRAPRPSIVAGFAAHHRGVFLEVAGHPLKLNLGKTETALQAARDNIALWSAALASDPDNGFARHWLSYNRGEEGALLRESNPAESVRAYRSAITEMTPLFKMTSANLEFQRTLARYHAEVALPLRKLGRQADARDSLLAALKMETALGEPRSFTRRECGDLELEAGDRKQALDHYQASLQLAHQRIKARPQDMLARRELADTHERLGRLYESSRDWNAAREWYVRSMEVWTTWTKYGLSSPYNETREKQAAENVDRCGRILLTNSPK